MTEVLRLLDRASFVAFLAVFLATAVRGLGDFVVFLAAAAFLVGFPDFDRATFLRPVFKFFLVETFFLLFDLRLDAFDAFFLVRFFLVFVRSRCAIANRTCVPMVW